MDAIKRNQNNRSNSGLVVKSNDLINGRYNLSIPEMRLFLLTIAQIEKDDEDLKTYRISIKDFMGNHASKHKGYWSQAKEYSKKLMSKVIEAPKIDGKPGDVTIVPLLGSADFIKGEGYAEVTFHPKIKPYLIQLKSHFTSYELHNVLKLRSSYSVRIYELLKQFQGIGYRTFLIEELKTILKITTQHSRYNDFKRTIILQTQKELTKCCDITFDYEEIKKARRVVAIKFFIRNNVNPDPDIKIISVKKKVATIPKNTSENLFLALKDLGISESQANNFMDNKSSDSLWKKIEYVKNKFENNKIQNTAAYLTRLIKDNAEIIAPIKKKRAQQSQQQREINFQAQKQIRELEKMLVDFNGRYLNKKRLIIEQFLINNELIVGEKVKKKCKEINPLVFRKYLHQKSLLENMYEYKTLESLIISATEKLYPKLFNELNEKALPYVENLNKKILELNNS